MGAWLGRAMSACAFVGFALASSPSAAQTPEPVAWAALVKTAPGGDRLTKTDAALDWDAGAVSTKGIASGDGYVDFTPALGDDYLVVGLGNGDANQGIADVEYAFVLSNGSLEIIESGSNRGAFGSYTSQTQLRIAIESGVVRYRKDGALLYESSLTPSYPLLVDTSLYAYGSSVRAALAGALTPLSVEPVAVDVASGNYPTAQTVTLTTDTPGALIHYTTTGVDPTESDPSVSSGGTVQVAATLHLKARAFKSGLGPSGMRSIRYVIGESSPTQAVAWVNLVKATASGDRVTKTDPAEVWDAGAVSTKAISTGDGRVDITPVPGGDYLVVGLGNGDPNQSFGDVEYGFLLGNGALQVIESGFLRGSFGSYTSQSLLTVAVENGIVRYRRDGTLLYESPVPPSYPLVVDASLYTFGSSVHAALTGVVASLSVEPVLFDVPSGNYAASQTVTLTTGTAGALIHYTMSGSDPTESDAWISSGGTLLVDATMQLKARAFKSGLGPSSVTSANYLIGATEVTEPVAWANLVNASASGNRVAKASNAELWDAGAVSTKAIAAGDGHVDISPVLGGDYLVIGLGNGDAGQGFQDVEYGFALSNGELQIVESGFFRGVFGSYTSQSELRIAVENGVVKYRRDGALLYESLVPPAYPLLVDTSLLVHGSSVKATVTGVLTPAWVETVTLAPGSGTYASAQSVTLTTATAGATIHYTTTGVDPTESDPSVSSGGVVQVTSTRELRARAFAGGLGPSAVASAWYVIGQSPTSEAVDWTNLVQAVEQGASLIKTGASAEPDAGGASTRALAYGDGHLDVTPGTGSAAVGLGNGDVGPHYSDIEYGFALLDGTLEIIEGGYSRGAFGSYTSQTPLRIAIESGVVCFRKDGALLFESAVPPTYPLLADTSLVSVASSVTAASLTGFLVSSAAATPQLSPAQGNYSVPQGVTITSATPGATVRYTLDGSDPTPSSALYASPVSISAPTTLKARAFHASYLPSAAATGVFTFTAAQPSFSLPAGTYSGAQVLTLTTATPGAAVHYNTSGVTPTTSDPSVASGGTVLIDRGVTFKAIAAYPGWTTSALTTALYRIDLGPAATPVASPVGGSYSSAQSVTLTTATSGAVIRYTLDGSEPDYRSALYTGPISIQASRTLKAKAFLAEHSPSTTLTETYDLDGSAVAVPLAVPAGGSYASRRVVTVTTTTAGATIHFTTDGEDPTESDPTIASGGTLAIEATQRIKLRAFKAGLDPSDVRVEDYILTGAIAAGSNFTLVLKTDGTVWAAGKNDVGQLGQGVTGDTGTPVQVNGLTDVVAIAAGEKHALAVLADGTVRGWGNNYYGQLGDNSEDDRYTPVAVSGLTNVVAVAGGNRASYFLKADGTVWASGSNGQGAGSGDFYQLGDGTQTDRMTAVQVVGLTGISQIAAGSNTGYALKTDGGADGTLWAWGGNSARQIGDGTVVNRSIAVSGRSPV